MSKLNAILNDLADDLFRPTGFEQRDYFSDNFEEAEQRIKDLMLETAEEAGLLGHDYATFEDRVNDL
jgi:hypothetical protein